MIVHEDVGYRSISKKTADMVKIVTGSGWQLTERAEKIHMRLAIEEMRNDALAEGKAESEAKSRAEEKAERL